MVILFYNILLNYEELFEFTGMLLSKKRTRSIRSLMGSPEIQAPNFDLNESDASDVETEQPTKRVALRVSLKLQTQAKH